MEFVRGISKLKPRQPICHKWPYFFPCPCNCMPDIFHLILFNDFSVFLPNSSRYLLWFSSLGIQVLSTFILEELQCHPFNSNFLLIGLELGGRREESLLISFIILDIIETSNKEKETEVSLSNSELRTSHFRLWNFITYHLWFLPSVCVSLNFHLNTYQAKWGQQGSLKSKNLKITHFSAREFLLYLFGICVG